jgi:hypothetical protein
LTLDRKRKAIWVATSNSDRIYRFDIGMHRWRQYPMPRKETFLRVIESSESSFITGAEICIDGGYTAI